jgi:hypothetical protein
METADTSAYVNRTTGAFKDVPMPETGRANERPGG